MTPDRRLAADTARVRDALRETAHPDLGYRELMTRTGYAWERLDRIVTAADDITRTAEDPPRFRLEDTDE